MKQAKWQIEYLEWLKTASFQKILEALYNNYLFDETPEQLKRSGFYFHEAQKALIEHEKGLQDEIERLSIQLNHIANLEVAQRAGNDILIEGIGYREEEIEKLKKWARIWKIAAKKYFIPFSTLKRAIALVRQNVIV